MIFIVLLVYLVVAYFFPATGLVALICMIGPVAMSVVRGRYWCGHICPRGNLFDKVVSRFSRNREIPPFVRSRGFRIFMLVFIFGMFGLQIYLGGFTAAAVGRVFWTIILVTTVVGILLGVLWSPRAWCTFCPMGTLSSYVAPRHRGKYPNIIIGESCKARCKSCAKACPMQLKPYEAAGDTEGFLHPDCLKCGKCTLVCPLKCAKME